MNTRLIAIVIMTCMFQIHAVWAIGPKPVYPVVGRPMPNFLVHNLEYYPKKEATLKDFAGKWLILDCWNEFCSSCVASFPETNSLQKEFCDKVKFVLVGDVISLSSYHGGIRKLYETYREKEHLKLTVAYDSAFFNRFDISGVPYVIVIDPKGIVQAITGPVSKENLKDLLSGKHPLMNRVFRGHENIEYDNTLPFLTYDNGGSDTSFVYRSVLSRWNPTLPHTGSPVLDSNANKIEVLRIGVGGLYLYAYTGTDGWNYGNKDSLYGNFYQKPILEVRDPHVFSLNSATGENAYSYSLILPPAKTNRKRLMEVMQGELKSYFGYTVSIETRMMPYWSLTATEEAKKNLLTKTKDPSAKEYDWEYSHAGFSYKNGKLNFVISSLAGMSHKEVFIDETGINGHIDISVNAIMTDFDDFRKELEKNGLYLIRKEKLMKVLVIKDPEE